MAGPQLAFPSPSLSQPNQIGFRNFVAVTSTQNWVVPAGVTAAKVTVVGGGAGAIGGGNMSGAGAGGTAIKMITGLVAGQVIPLTIAAAVSANTAGQTSSFGSYCSATGGTIDRLGGLGIGGDINIRGGSGGAGFGFQSGQNCVGSPVFSSTQGFGGQSTHGAGAYGQVAVATGVSGTAVNSYGGGGSSGSTTGGGGSQGLITIEY